MPNLTLAIPEEVKQKMEKFPEINWSEVARQAIIQKTKVLERMEMLLSKSKLTEKETLVLGQEVKERVWKHHRVKR